MVGEYNVLIYCLFATCRKECSTFYKLGCNLYLSIQITAVNVTNRTTAIENEQRHRPYYVKCCTTRQFNNINIIYFPQNCVNYVTAYYDENIVLIKIQK